MYVRNARNNEEEWLLNLLEDNGLDWQSFRSRDFKFVCSQDTDEVLALGRLTTHKTDSGSAWFELRSVYITPEGKQVRAGQELISAFVEKLNNSNISRLYTVTSDPDKFKQFGFETLSDEVLTDPVLNRVEQKAEFLNTDVDNLSVSRLMVEDYLTNSEISHDEVQAEKESQGFDEEHTHKYST